MLNVHQITRHLKAGHLDSLLRGTTPLGIELSLPLETRISQQPAAVIALALRRIVELTYGPAEACRLTLASLLRLANADGSFGDGGTDPQGRSRGDCLATAAVADALSRMLSENHATHADRQAAFASRDAALIALAGMQEADGLFISGNDRTQEDRTLTAAFILALLAGCAEFRSQVRFADLLNWFDDHSDRLDDTCDTLFRLARVDAPLAPAASAASGTAASSGSARTPHQSLVAA
ncbi:MAG: hypothetical protein WD768_22980 [Phycisphaeraceae bacterium]